MKPLVILATGIGLGGSAAATYRAHRKPMSPAWDQPVGDTRFRRSDLPIGGAVAMVLAFGSLVTGHRRAAAVMAGAGLGATAGSLGVALMEPLADTGLPGGDSAEGLAADAQEKASQWEQESDQAVAPGATVEPASATFDDGDDARAEQQLEQAAEAVEHQASYSSPSLDDVAPESVDEAAWEPEVTGSAPQEGQSPDQDTRSNDEDA